MDYRLLMTSLIATAAFIPPAAAQPNAERRPKPIPMTAAQKTAVKSLNAFRDVCLLNTGDAAGIERAAQRAGFRPTPRPEGTALPEGKLWVVAFDKSPLLLISTETGSSCLTYNRRIDAASALLFVYLMPLGFRNMEGVQVIPVETKNEANIVRTAFRVRNLPADPNLTDLLVSAEILGDVKEPVQLYLAARLAKPTLLGATAPPSNDR